MRTLLLLAAGLTLTASAPSPRTVLLRARAEARAAELRVAALEARAATFASAASRARSAQTLAVARIAVAEAGISEAEATLRIVEARRRIGRVRLAAQERPTVMLLAGLQTLGRRPPALALIQRGTLQDLVHTRALLASTLPAIAARTVALRADLAAATHIQQESATAAAALRARRAELDVERGRLAAIERASVREGQIFVDAALGEGDRALALGEDARALATQDRQRGSDAATLRRLAALTPPSLPSLPPGAASGRARTGTRPAYLLPVEGRVVTGAGEISDAGVHARGTTIATAPEASVVAPAAGRIVYAAPFRSYGAIVIIDHGGGWTTTITDLQSLEVAAGATVDRGDTLGTARSRNPRITIELRQGGRPVPIAPFL